MMIDDDDDEGRVALVGVFYGNALHCNRRVVM